MIANIIRYDLRSVQGVDHDADYLVSEDIDKEPEPITISNWNTAKLGPQKTLAQYRTIGQTAAFQTWHEDFTVAYKKKRRKARDWATGPRQEIIWRTIAIRTGSTLQQVKSAVQQAITDTITEP